MKFSKEARVGIVVVAALVGLIWGFNYLKGTELFSTSNKYFALYDNVEGLVATNPVFLNGFRIGQVDKIKYLPDNSGRIVITLRINSGVFVAKNSKAVIISSDFLGTKAVEIKYSEEKIPATDKDTLIGETQQSFTQEIRPFKDKAESLVQSLDSLAAALKLLVNPEARNSLQNTFKNFEHASANIDKLVSDQNSKLRLMISNAEQISLTLKNNNDKLANIITNFSQISDSLAKVNFAATMNNANKVLAETGQIMDKINRGEGSLGLLINNDSLYTNLNTTAADLDKLLLDLKANPKRYLHFSVFGKSAK